MKRMMQCLLLAALSTTAGGQEKSIVRYLANEGVMITHGDTTILFDPLFADSYGQYQMVPQNVLDAIFAGAAPFDGVDAVFISHFHGDHFSASEVLRLLQVRREIALYAPAQAVAEMRRIATSDDAGIFDRITIFDLDYGDAPVFVRQEGLLIEAVHVPHSGWPTARTDVQNITFRVTLEDTSTVLHLGDADARLVHFELDVNYWDERRIDLAFPPYWFFLSDDGREILENRINIRNSIGIHVPARFGDAPSSVPDELLGDDLFTRPGEGRRFTGTQ
jgi:L-ascorbate metabolism protein UlaG (beta-lactamase superfamily)